jgi:hypothetical protein
MVRCFSATWVVFLKPTTGSLNMKTPNCPLPFLVISEDEPDMFA